nr:hypothetical protein RP007_01613 [Rhizobium sp. P007]
MLALKQEIGFQGGRSRRLGVPLERVNAFVDGLDLFGRERTALFFTPLQQIELEAQRVG